MNCNREGLLLPESKEPKLDTEVFGSFQKTHENLRETYEDLAPSEEKKNNAILSWANGQDADLSADNLDVDDIANYQNSFRNWKQDLLTDNNIGPNVKQIYRWRINEDIAKTNMLIASNNKNNTHFDRWNEYIYGRPNEQIYKAALDWIANDAENILSVSDNENVINSAQVVLDLLKDKRGDMSLLIPNPETFENVKNDHIRPMGYYGLLLAGVDIPEGKINNDIGDGIIKHIVKDNLESDYDVKDASGATWSVSHSEKAIKRPASYNLVSKRFVGLGLGHEIGSHLLEKVNGERGPLNLASEGLDRYELGNEGRAIIREQVQYETFDEFGKLIRWRDILRRHISISYAVGVGESSPASSSEVYKFMNAIDVMYQAKSTPDADFDTIKEKADKKTSSLLLRVLKGTDGSGGAYYKDKVYLEGVVAVWLTADKKGPSSISEGDLGKFDINSPRHIKALKDIGFLPERE